MKRMLLPIFAVASVFLWSLIFWGTCCAFEIHDINVVKIAPDDNRAVIEIKGTNKLEVIAPGDKLSRKIKVLGIVKERVVLDVKGAQGPEKVIFWVRNGKQEIRTIRYFPEKRSGQYIFQRISKAK